MFWKKKNENQKKPLSPKEQLTQKIEMLKPGEEISYLLPPTFGGSLATLVCNPQYPDKGKRFIMYTVLPVDGKTDGPRRFLWESNKAEKMATWVMDRVGEEVPPIAKAS